MGSVLSQVSHLIVCFVFLVFKDCYSENLKRHAPFKEALILLLYVLLYLKMMLPLILPITTTLKIEGEHNNRVGGPWGFCCLETALSVVFSDLVKLCDLSVQVDAVNVEVPEKLTLCGIYILCQ